MRDAMKAAKKAKRLEEGNRIEMIFDCNELRWKFVYIKKIRKKKGKKI